MLFCYPSQDADHTAAGQSAGSSVGLFEGSPFPTHVRDREKHQHSGRDDQSLGQGHKRLSQHQEGCDPDSRPSSLNSVP
jgi:hypothetical protein